MHLSMIIFVSPSAEFTVTLIAGSRQAKRVVTGVQIISIDKYLVARRQQS